MSVIGSSILAGASGSAGGDPVYVDDVFSTYVYEGNGTTGDAGSAAVLQTINNGIDLAGEGGLVWIKTRNSTYNHVLTDTERGKQYYISADNTNANSSAQFGNVSGFTSTGFTLGGGGMVNDGIGFNPPPLAYASWTFRKAPGFLDIVTWTGNSTAGRQIPHALGSVPGMILVKRTNASESWQVYHRSMGATKYIQLNDTGNSGASPTRWNNTAPTDSVFTVGTASGTNQTGGEYVAYIFAHDDASFGTDGDESIIKCGSYAGNVTGANLRVDVGFEPQFVLIKSSSTFTDWHILDVMRGAADSGSDQALLAANQSSAENSSGIRLFVTNEGFGTNQQTGTNINAAGQTYIYMAIRRPNKPPELATEVFATAFRDNSEPGFNSGFPVDFAFEHYTTGGNASYPGVGSRLIGNKQLVTSASAAEVTNSTYDWDYMDGWNNVESTSTTIFSHMFKRAPGFMDVVTFSGTGGNQNITHNLEVAPEFYIVKRRSATEDWATYSAALGANKYTKLNSNASSYTNTTIWNNTSPTSSVFTVGNDVSVNGSGSTYIAYLFATLPGISKVGVYNGTGNALNVDCGFTNGARFILIKRTDSSGDWYVWDSVRGIVSGNDPYLLLNTTASQVTNTDYIDPLSTGFTVTSSAPAALNTSGGTYIFLAIA